MPHRFSRAPADRRSIAALGVLAAGVLLAACGSAMSTNSVASSEKSRERQLLQLAKCLREHGIDLQTPTAGGPIRIQGTGNITPQTMEAARAACKKYAPADRVKLTPQQRVEREEAVQKFARCMREHGIKVEAQTAEGGAGVGIRIHRGEGGPNPESPAFEGAQKTCQTYLPKPPGGARLGGPGGAPSTGKSGAGGRAGGPKLGFQLGG